LQCDLNEIDTRNGKSSQISSQYHFEDPDHSQKVEVRAWDGYKWGSTVSVSITEVTDAEIILGYRSVRDVNNFVEHSRTISRTTGKLTGFFGATTDGNYHETFTSQGECTEIDPGAPPARKF
jgi:hypothetical protein